MTDWPKPVANRQLHGVAGDRLWQRLMHGRSFCAGCGGAMIDDRAATFLGAPIEPYGVGNHTPTCPLLIYTVERTLEI